MHHLALADCCRSLLHAKLAWPFAQRQLRRADGDGAGGHQNQLIPHALQIGQHTHQALHTAQIYAARRVRQCGRADLDHNPFVPVSHA